MISCSHCAHDNRPGAFFCRQCGRPLACPRCRIIVEYPLNFCDNCGQPLSLEDEFQIISVPGIENLSRDTAGSKPSPPAGALYTPAEQSLANAQSTRLEQFVPNELMAKLDHARSSGAMVGERRVVTILFCDVKGSTEAAESLDPEDWTEIINGAFEHMIKPVYKYEGTVARLMGDGILAFFGAPIAHEDDPQRAILAGLDIVEAIEAYKDRILLEWEIELGVRVGINTGRVVVGAVGSDLRMEYTAMGDAINLAARMEETAKPGTVQVAHNTYKITAPLFEFEELGNIDVRGKTKPVPVYRALSRKSSPGRIRGIEGMEIELIGRDVEMANLRDAVDDLRRGVGRVVTILGEAGIGKSRLVREFHALEAALAEPENSERSGLDDSRKQAPGPEWIETASLSYETAQPYALFRRLLRKLNGINLNEPTLDLGEKIDQLVAYLPDEEANRSRKVFEALFGVQSENGEPPLEGEAFKRALFDLMPTLWRRRFADKPTIIVFEDLHWSDPASVDLLHDLMPLLDEMAMLFLCVLRPYKNKAAWTIKETADRSYGHRYSEIILKPLSEKQSNQMIDSLLGNPVLPDELRKQILDQAAGNPFFIEEVVRTLIDEGLLLPAEGSNGHPGWQVSDRATDIDIPDNLQALLTARIDNLSEGVRQTLQLASVIGRNFYRRILLEIVEESEQVDNHIRILLQQEMIREAARVPEMEYRFRNPLTQEAAYRTILVKHRKELHRQVGEVMERLFADRLDEQATQLAYHFREAEAYDKALSYYQKAGDLAFRLFANSEATTHYGLAIEMARRIKAGIPSETLRHLYSRRGRALEHQVVYQEALENYEAMLSHARELDDKRLALEAMMAMATAYSVQTPHQDVARSRALSEEALELAQSLGDRAAEATINWNLMNVYAFSEGDMDQGLAYGEASLAIARDLGLKEQMGYTLNSMIMIYFTNTHIAEGQELLEEVRQLWQELDNLPMLADSYGMTGFSLMMSGDYKSAIEALSEGERISRSINNIWNLSVANLFLGQCTLEIGQISAGLAYVQEAEKLSSTPDLFSNWLLAKILQAHAYWIMGDNAKALALTEEVYLHRSKMMLYDRSLFQGLVASMFVRCGSPSKAGEVLDEMGDFDWSTGNTGMASYFVGASAELALVEGRYEQVDEMLEPVIQRLLELGADGSLPYLYYLQGKARLSSGDQDRASEAFTKALEKSWQTGERTWRWWIQAAMLEISTHEKSPDSTISEEWRKKTQESIRYVGDHILDQDRRQAYYDRDEISSLMAVETPE